MINYYEVLELDQTASKEMIEIKLDEQYAKWRALVTHHDPNIATQASKAIQTIEEARETLTNPLKKHSYDQSLQAHLATMGGLVDPTLVVNQPVTQPGFGMAMPRRPIVVTAPAQNVERLDAWTCKKCQKANPKGTTFCSNCGGVVGVNCPSCGALGDYSEKFCSECGKDKKAEFEKNKKFQLQGLGEAIAKVEEEISFVKQDPVGFAKNKLNVGKFGGCVIVLIVAVLILVVSFTVFLVQNEGYLGLLFLLPVTVGLIYAIASRNMLANQAAKRHLQSREAQLMNMKQEFDRLRAEKY